MRRWPAFDGWMPSSRMRRPAAPANQPSLIGSTKMAPIEVALPPQLGPDATDRGRRRAVAPDGADDDDDGVRERIPQPVKDGVGGLGGGFRPNRLSLWPAATNTIPGRALTTAATRVRTGWPVQPGLTKPVPATDRLTTRQPCAALTIAGQPRLPMPAPAQPVVYESPRKAATGRGTVDAGTARRPVRDHGRA